MTHALQSKAMLASLSISAWSARKLDREVTDETNRAHNASADAGRYNKALLSRDALGEITAAVSEAGVIFRARTLPWADAGTRILSAAGHAEYSAEMRRVEGRFWSAVDRFCANYPAYVEQARQTLNGMFKAADYPDAADIRDRFKFKRRFYPIPDAADFRVNVTDAERDRIKAEIEADMADTLKDATRDVFARVADVVGTMATKLSAYQPATKKGETSKGIFRDSLVENVRELARLLPTLNVTGDQRLDALKAQLDALAFHDAAELRDSDNTRAKVAAEAAAIKAAVTDFMA